MLSGGPRRAGEIATEIGMSAPAMSRHLRVLLEAQVIEDERLEEDARARVFRLRPQSITAARTWLDEILAGRGEASGAAASCGFGRITARLV